MTKKIYIWIEEYLFYPNLFQKLISLLFLPLTFIYLLIISFKKLGVKKIDFKIPIISVGNLVVGGSGKTPLVIKLASNKKNVAIILRGYGRQSKGLYVISHNGKLLENISVSGDEAMLLAKSLKNSTVIVSEDRKKGILKAKSLDCKLVFLDDGFSKYDILKFDILLRPKIEPTNIFCLPSGGYREPKMLYSSADLVLKEGVDFSRIVSFTLNNQSITVLPEKLILLTAISKPQRLLDFLPKDIEIELFEDHHNFTKDEISKILLKYKKFSFITTRKDFVKLDKFCIENLYIMELDINLHKPLVLMENYIKHHHKATLLEV